MQVAIVLLSPSCIGLAAPCNFRPEVALSHTRLGITETIASLSSNNKIFKLYIIAVTATTLPVGGQPPLKHPTRSTVRRAVRCNRWSCCEVVVVPESASRLAHFFGNFVCFGESKWLPQPNNTMYFLRRYPTGKKRHKVGHRHTCPAAQLRHLFRALFDDLAFTLTQGMDALD
ncbi:hypothetical protein T06_7326 [Trichinella sp. T6]|nr:hypothetical protein T06_7326 [Trichinella sp. T6]